MKLTVKAAPTTRRRVHVSNLKHRVASFRRRAAEVDDDELFERFSEMIHDDSRSFASRGFTQLVHLLGYSDSEEFFDDNPGALDAILEFIGGNNWSTYLDQSDSLREKLEREGDGDSDDDEDDWK